MELEPFGSLASVLVDVVVSLAVETEEAFAAAAVDEAAVFAGTVGFVAKELLCLPEKGN